MRKVVIGTLLIIILVGGALLLERSLRRDRPVPALSVEGQVLPTSVKIQSLETRQVTGMEKFTGKVVLINFWATWCTACVQEMPSIQKLYETLKAEDFEVIGLNVDENPEKVVAPLMKKLGLTFPIYTDVEESMAKAFDVTAIPFSAVLDRQGKVVWSEAGERDWASEKVIGEIRKLL